MLYPGFHILVYHRIAHFLYKIKLFFLARLISQIGRFFTKLARLICIKRHELFGSIKISPQLCTNILLAKKL